MRFILFFFLMMSFGVTAQTSYSEAEKLFVNKQFEEAKTLFLSHLEANPNNLKILEYLGDIAGHQKKWDEAIKYYKMLVDAAEDNANYYYKYGGALGMKSLSVSKFKALSLIDDVEDAFLKAAELDAKHIDTRWALVELYIKLPGILGGSTKKALKYANELENLSKVDGYLAKGFIYDYKDDFKNAEVNYKKAVEVGGSVTCYQKLTDLYVKHNRKQEAIDTLQIAYQAHQKTDFLVQIERLKKAQ